jgi:hypothetical protein
MRFIVFVRANADTEAGAPPSEAELAAMTDFNERLVDAGIMRGGEGLHPTSTGARLDYVGGEVSVTAGPFADLETVVAGFWLLEAGSIEEITEWMREAPFTDQSLEVRQILEAEDFGDALTPELRDREQAMRRRTENRVA